MNTSKENQKEIEFLQIVSESSDEKIQEYWKANKLDVAYFNNIFLRKATERNKSGITKMLLEAGADVQTQNGAPLRMAATRGATEMVKILLEHGADIHANKGEALYMAACNNHIKTVKCLLDAGADVSKKFHAALMLSAECGHTEIVDLLLDKGDYRKKIPSYAVIALAGTGRAQEVDSILQISKQPHDPKDTTPRANIRTVEKTALQYAARQGHNEVIQTLIKHGAKFTPDSSAIYEATHCRRLQTIKLLLQAGASPLQDGEHNPILASEANKTHEITKVLLKAYSTNELESLKDEEKFPQEKLQAEFQRRRLKQLQKQNQKEPQIEL